ALQRTRLGPSLGQPSGVRRTERATAVAALRPLLLGCDQALPLPGKEGQRAGRREGAAAQRAEAAGGSPASRRNQANGAFSTHRTGQADRPPPGRYRPASGRAALPPHERPRGAEQKLLLECPWQRGEGPPGAGTQSLSAPAGSTSSAADRR